MGNGCSKRSRDLLAVTPGPSNARASRRRSVIEIEAAEELDNLWPTLKYLPYELISRRWKVDTEMFDQSPGVETLTCGTVLCAEFSGLSTMLADADTEVLSAGISQYFSAIVDIFDDHGGDVIKFFGDIFIVLFNEENGQRTPQDNRKISALRAAQCALEVHKKLGSGRVLGAQIECRIVIGTTPRLFELHIGTEGRHNFLLSGHVFSQMQEAVQLASLSLSTGIKAVMLTRQTWDVVGNDCKPKSSPDHFELYLDAVVRPVPITSFSRCRGGSSVAEGLDSNDVALLSYLPRLAVCARFVAFPADLRRVSVVHVHTDELWAHDGEDMESAQHVYESVMDVLTTHGGYLLRFYEDHRGKAIVYVFGVPPFDFDDYVARAVRSAVELVPILSAMGARYSIGISSGLVFSGSIVSNSRRFHLVIGPPTAAAERLAVRARLVFQKSQSAGMLPIVCDGTTFGAASSLAVLAPVFQNQNTNTVTIGRKMSRKQSLSTLLQRKPPDAPESSDNTDNEVMFVVKRLRATSSSVKAISGRVEVLAVCWDSLDLVLEGRVASEGARVVCLEGVRGSGKTELLLHFVSLVKQRPGCRIITAHLSHHTRRPFELWRQVLTGLFRLTDTTDPQMRTHWAHKWLSQRLTEDEMQLAHVLNPVLGIALDRPDSHVGAKKWLSMFSILMVAIIHAASATQKSTGEKVSQPEVPLRRPSRRPSADDALAVPDGEPPRRVRRFSLADKVDSDIDAPCVFAIDDVHMCDPESFEVLEQVMRAAPTFFVVTALPSSPAEVFAREGSAGVGDVRTPGEKPSDATSDATSVKGDWEGFGDGIETRRQFVGGFDQLEMRDFVSKVVAAGSVPPALVQAVLEVSHGNAAHAFSCVLEFQRLGMVTVVDRVCKLTDTILSTEIVAQTTVKQMLKRRIEALPPTQRLLLRTAAVLGRYFNDTCVAYLFAHFSQFFTDMLREISVKETFQNDALEAAVHSLEESGIFRSLGDDLYCFVSADVFSLCQKSLSSLLASQLHAMAAHWYEEQFQDDKVYNSSSIGMHCIKSWRHATVAAANSALAIMPVLPAATSALVDGAQKKGVHYCFEAAKTAMECQQPMLAMHLFREAFDAGVTLPGHIDKDRISSESAMLILYGRLLLRHSRATSDDANKFLQRATALMRFDGDHRLRLYNLVAEQSEAFMEQCKFADASTLATWVVTTSTVDETQSPLRATQACAASLIGHYFVGKARFLQGDIDNAYLELAAIDEKYEHDEHSAVLVTYFGMNYAVGCGLPMLGFCRLVQGQYGEAVTLFQKCSVNATAISDGKASLHCVLLATLAFCALMDIPNFQRFAKVLHEKAKDPLCFVEHICLPGGLADFLWEAAEFCMNPQTHDSSRFNTPAASFPVCFSEDHVCLRSVLYKFLAYRALTIGEHQLGLDLIQSGMDFMTDTAETLMLPEFYRLSGQLLLAMRHSNALEQIWKAVDVSREAGACALLLAAVTDLSRALVKVGRHGDAIRELRSALHECPTTVDVASVRHVRQQLDKLVG